MVAAEHTHEWRYHYVEWHHGFVLGKYVRCYSMVYIKTVQKREIVYLDVHSAAPRFKKMRFSKFVNSVNALAIHNQQIVVRAFQIPPAAHRALCYSMVYTYIELVKKRKSVISIVTPLRIVSNKCGSRKLQI